MALLTERYSKQIDGILSCYDRRVIAGTLPQTCYADSMTSYLYHHNIRIFDYAKFAEPLRNELRSNAEDISKANEIEIEFVKKQRIRKESLVQKILDKRGYEPWHNKKTHRTYLKSKLGRCLHYYFYFIDEMHLKTIPFQTLILLYTRNLQYEYISRKTARPPGISTHVRR